MESLYIVVELAYFYNSKIPKFRGAYRLPLCVQIKLGISTLDCDF